MKLKSRIEILKPDEVYNLHIEKDHNYIVEGAVVSNCHMAKADVLKKLLTTTFANVPIRWGLTGTIPKEENDAMSLLASIGETVHTVQASELQERGVLSNCNISVLQLRDYVEFKDYAAEHKYLVEDEERIYWVSNLLKKLSSTGNTLILISRIETGNMLMNHLPDASFVHGAVENKERKEHYEEIGSSDNKILIATFGTAAVGIDIPRIFNLVLLEPGKSFVRVIQSIGRGIRKAKDKDFVNIYDITSTCKFSSRHLTQRKKFYKEAKYPFEVSKIEYRKNK